MHDLRIIPAYPSIAINLEHTRSLRIRAEKSPTTATKYQLAVYSQDPDDVLVLPLDGCESLEAAQAALRDLVAPQHGCGHAHEHDEWDASPEDLRATIDEVEAANEKLENKLANVGKALDAFANAFTRALPAIAEPMRGVLQQFASWLIEARRELGLTEHDLREGFAGLHASVPEADPAEIDALLDRVVSSMVVLTSEPEPSATEQPNEGDRELAQLVNSYSAGNELGENLHTAAARWLFPLVHVYGELLRELLGQRPQTIAYPGATEPEHPKPSATERLATEFQHRTFRVGWEADVGHVIRSWLADVGAIDKRVIKVNEFIDAISAELLTITAMVGVDNFTVTVAGRLSSVINRLSNMATLLDYERDDHFAYAAASRAAWRCRDYLVIAHKRVSH